LGWTYGCCPAASTGTRGCRQKHDGRKCGRRPAGSAR
jgi:hypothetical protein